MNSSEYICTFSSHCRFVGNARIPFGDTNCGNVETFGHDDDVDDDVVVVS